MLYYHLIITSLETISKEIDLSDVICKLLPENIMLTDRLYDPIAPDNFQQCLSYFNGNLAQLDKTISSNYKLVDQFYSESIGPFDNDIGWRFFIETDCARKIKELIRNSISYHSLDACFNEIKNALFASNYTSLENLESIMYQSKIVDIQSKTKLINEWQKCCMDIVKAELSIWNYQPNPNLTEGSISAIIQCKSRKQLESIFNKTGLAQDYAIQFLTFRDYMQKYLQKQETKSFPISIANAEREFLCVELSSFYDFQVFNDPKWIKWYRNNYLF